MKAIFAAIKRSPKLSALMAVFVAAVVVPAGLMAWGPDRPTFTMASPATHITFNSITDNPNIGDERNFVTIREKGTNNLWADDMNVQPGKTYTVRMYVHNNAASNLNLVAQNVKAKFGLPTTTGKSLEVQGFISASNATPNEVYDHATFKSDQDFNVKYVPGSLRFFNNKFGGGTSLPESIFTNTGAALGYESLNGQMPGCLEYAGYVGFDVTPQFATNFDVKKEVKKTGTTGWQKSVTVNPGDSVDYLLSYKNTSGSQQNNVWFRDTLPAQISYTTGSTTLTNVIHPNGLKLSDNLTNGTGVNVGSYAKDAVAYVKFSAKVNAEKLLCGPQTLTNKVRVNVNNDLYKEDTANVVVNKDCKPGEINVCELATKRIITIKESDFNPSKHSKNLADCKNVPVTELPQTGIDSGVVAFAGLGALTAAAAYAVRSPRVRNLLRG